MCLLRLGFAGGTCETRPENQRAALHLMVWNAGIDWVHLPSMHLGRTGCDLSLACPTLLYKGEVNRPERDATVHRVAGVSVNQAQRRRGYARRHPEVWPFLLGDLVEPGAAGK